MEKYHHSWSFRISLLVVVLCFLVIGSLIYFNKSQPSSLCNQSYILLDFKYTEGNFSLINKTLYEGCFPKNKYSDNLEYGYNLVTNNYSYGKGSFNAGVIFIDNLEGSNLVGGVDSIKENIISLSVPYTEADNIQILKEGVIIYENKIFDVNATSCRI